MKCSICGENGEVLIVEITDKNGVKIYCPNCIIYSYMNGKLHLENCSDFADDITGKFGAVKYKNFDEVYTLEKDTMTRLITRNLLPEEYFSLVTKYGADKFLLHGDFYDPSDGCALQPVG